MTFRQIKIGIVAISAGVGIGLLYELAVSGLSPQRIVLLLYVAVVIGAFFLMPGPEPEPEKKVEPEATVKEGKTGPEEIILGIIRQVGKAKRSDFFPQLAMSKSSLVRLLDEMEAKGLITQVGQKKGAYYVLKGPGS